MQSPPVNYKVAQPLYRHGALTGRRKQISQRRAPDSRRREKKQLQLENKTAARKIDGRYGYGANRFVVKVADFADSLSVWQRL